MEKKVDRTFAWSNALKTRLVGVVLLGTESRAFAAFSLPIDQWPTDQWSSYLLFGSIALLVCGVLVKMFTYQARSRTESTEPLESDERFTIGAYRNRTLSPGR
jgi:hypothetical protein